MFSCTSGSVSLLVAGLRVSFGPLLILLVRATFFPVQGSGALSTNTLGTASADQVSLEELKQSDGIRDIVHDSLLLCIYPVCHSHLPSVLSLIHDDLIVGGPGVQGKRFRQLETMVLTVETKAAQTATFPSPVSPTNCGRKPEVPASSICLDQGTFLRTSVLNPLVSTGRRLTRYCPIPADTQELSNRTISEHLAVILLVGYVKAKKLWRKDPDHHSYRKLIAKNPKLVKLILDRLKHARGDLSARISKYLWKHSDGSELQQGICRCHGSE